MWQRLSFWTRRLAWPFFSSAKGVVFCIACLVILLLLFLREVKAQTESTPFYVQIVLSPQKSAALTNAAAIINTSRTGDGNSPFVTPGAVFSTITAREVDDLCNRLISTDPKAIVRRFNRKD